MSHHIHYAFQQNLLSISLERIVPCYQSNPKLEKSVKFQSILASIREIGIIEPLVVYPDGDDFLLLDGHLRLFALQKIGKVETLCLISTDDETFTYNKKINRLSTIQEHQMLLKAIERGVPEKLIARTLNVNIQTLKARLNLLNGIAKPVIRKLADKQVSKEVFRILRKMTPDRQIEVAEMMVASNKFSHPYANMLLMASKPEELLENKKAAKPTFSPEQREMMKREMDRLRENWQISEDKLAELQYSLILAKGYVGKLLAHPIISEFIEQKYSDEYLAMKEVYQELSMVAG